MSTATGNQTTTYSYDGRGNLTGTSSGNGAKATTASYTYDAADRLTGATLSSGFSATYGYDADGRRVKQIVGTAVTNYLWDEQSPYGDVVTETDGSGAVQASYVLGGSALLAQVRGSGAGATASYILPDGQGSVRALANSTGAITDTYRYDAYGNQTSSTGTTPNPYRYDGQRLDDGTGLYQLRARSYDPGTGRFLSPDTAAVAPNDPIELNRYAYVHGDPLDFTDPSGHGPLADFAAELLTIGRGAVTLVVVGTVTLIQDLYTLGLLGEVLTLVARIQQLYDFTLHNAEFIAGMLTGLSGGIPSGSGGPPPAPGPVPGAGGIPAATPGCGGVSNNLNPTDPRVFQITAAGWGAFGG